MGIKTKKLILILLGGLARSVANTREKTDMIKILGVALLAGLLVFNTSAFSGTTTREIDGYQRAKWGMSPEEVKKAYPKLKYNPLEKVSYLSDEYPGEVLTEDLVSTFSFSNTVLRKYIRFKFYFYRNQLHKVELSSSRPLDYKYFKWFWEAIEQKYKPTEGPREFPISLSLYSWLWKDAEGNTIHLFWENTEGLYVSYVNPSMTRKLNEELEKLEEEKAEKRRRELEGIF